MVFGDIDEIKIKYFFKLGIEFTNILTTPYFLGIRTSAPGLVRVCSDSNPARLSRIN